MTWDMDEEVVDFYSADRWDNWLARLEETDLDDEEECSRLYLNLQNDTAIAVAKVLSYYDEGALSEETAIDELTTIQEIVLDEPDLEDEEAVMMIDAVQTSLVCVFMAADQYLADGRAADASVESLIEAAEAAEAEEEFNDALAYMAQAGTLVIDGEELDLSLAEDLEYGLVTEWLGGLGSLHEALSGPIVVEED